MKEVAKRVYSFLGGYGTAKLFAGETEGKQNSIIIQPRTEASTNSKEEKLTTSEIITVVLIIAALCVIIIAIKVYLTKLISSAQKVNLPTVQYIANTTPRAGGKNLNP